MKHISQIIAEMSDEWKANAGVAKPTVDGAALVAKMAAESELDWLNATRPDDRKAKHGAIRHQIRRRT